MIQRLKSIDWWVVVAYILVGVSLALVINLLLPTKSHAQTCTDPTRRINVTTQPTGLVTLSSPYTITSVAFTPDSNARYRAIVGGVIQAPVVLPSSITTNSATVQFYLNAASPSAAVTVQMNVTDVCGSWPTFAGGGPAVLPTSGPLATVPPTATPVPTSTPITPVVIPTATPQTVSLVSSFPEEVHQGGDIWISWFGRTSPSVGDYVALATVGGTLAGPPIFTSSCTSTQGSVAKSQGMCKITLGVAFNPDNYLVRFYGNNNSNNVLATGNKYLKVKAVGAALLGRGQVWGSVASWVIPEISLIGGFVGFQASLNAGDANDLSAGDKYHHLGLADFALLGDNFIEAGTWRSCSPGVPRFCSSYPYMSWMDHSGEIQQRTWNGFATMPHIPLTPGNMYVFQVYETAETFWTANLCDEGVCCPIWESGIPCTGRKVNDVVPRTLLARMKMIFAGSETPLTTSQAGATRITNPSYCCHYGLTNWTPLSCWDQKLINVHRTYVFADVSPCVPYTGWYTEQWLN